MKYSELVKINNPVVFSILNNALKNNKVPHAYLFSAQNGQIIENEYLFIVQELISKDKIRDPKKYTDLFVLDGSESLIKKENVIQAISTLQQTTLDESGIKILVIKNIEHSNKQSINSLLKFLEEPTKNTYILMTTNNLGAVLPTIKSRSQVVSIKPITSEKLTKNIEKIGVNKHDARLLANMFSSVEEAAANYNDEFKKNKKALIDAMKDGLNNKETLITKLIPLIKKANYEIPLMIIREFISDIWRFEQLLPLSMYKEKGLIEKYNLINFNFTKSLEAINKFIIMRKYHVNFDLEKSKMIIKIGESYE